MADSVLTSADQSEVQAMIQKFPYTCVVRKEITVQFKKTLGNMGQYAFSSLPNKTKSQRADKSTENGN